MFAAPPDMFLIVLWSIAAVAVVVACLPMILAMLGFTRVQIKPIGGPDAVPTDDADPEYAQVYDRLRELGFEPCGVRVEIGWFYAWFWKHESLPSPLFANADGTSFATLYHLFHGDPWRILLATVLDDGTLITTANNMQQLRINRPGYWRRGYPTKDPADLLREHHADVERFLARGGAAARLDLQEYCDIAAQRTEEYLRASGKGTAFQCLRIALVLIAVGPLLGGFFLGFGHWGVPLAAIGAALALAVLAPLSVRVGAGNIRRKEAENLLANRWASARRRRFLEGTGPAAERGDGLLPEEPSESEPETIRVNPPPQPPTDLTWPSPPP